MWCKAHVKVLQIYHAQSTCSPDHVHSWSRALDVSQFAYCSPLETVDKAVTRPSLSTSSPLRTLLGVICRSCEKFHFSLLCKSVFQRTVFVWCALHFLHAHLKRIIDLANNVGGSCIQDPPELSSIWRKEDCVLKTWIIFPIQGSTLVHPEIPSCQETASSLKPGKEKCTVPMNLHGVGRSAKSSSTLEVSTKGAPHGEDTANDHFVQTCVY